MNSSQAFNCMGCHTTDATIILGTDTLKNSKSPLYFSHLFRSYLSKSSGVSKNDIELLRIKEFLNAQDKNK
jgi:hypothetical protein